MLQLNKIEVFLKRKKITKQILVEKMGITYKTLYNIIKNNNCPADKLQLMARILDVPITEFFTQEESTHQTNLIEKPAITDINRRIKQIMSTMEMDQSHFAKSIGVSDQRLSAQINGNYKPNLEMIEKIAIKYPDINLRWLITGEGEMHSEHNLSIAAEPEHEYKPKCKNCDSLIKDKKHLQMLIEELCKKSGIQKERNVG